VPPQVRPEDNPAHIAPNGKQNAYYVFRFKGFKKSMKKELSTVTLSLTTS
jgi:hypothetical protein